MTWNQVSSGIQQNVVGFINMDDYDDHQILYLDTPTTLYEFSGMKCGIEYMYAVGVRGDGI